MHIKFLKILYSPLLIFSGGEGRWSDGMVFYSNFVDLSVDLGGSLLGRYL